MAPSDNSFTDNLSAIDRMYAARAGVETGEDGKVPHIDSANQVQPGADEDGFGGDAPEPNGGTPEPEVVDPETDPDVLSEAELEAATAPEEEQA